MQLLSVVTAEERRGTDKVLEEKLELGKEGEREYGGRDTVLIVDDICSFGGTFYFSAQKLTELGAKKIYLFISHCEKSILNGKLINCELINKIYTTDSIYNCENKKIEIVTL